MDPRAARGQLSGDPLEMPQGPSVPPRTGGSLCAGLPSGWDPRAGQGRGGCREPCAPTLTGSHNSLRSLESPAASPGTGLCQALGLRGQVWGLPAGGGGTGSAGRGGAARADSFQCPSSHEGFLPSLGSSEAGGVPGLVGRLQRGRPPGPPSHQLPPVLTQLRAAGHCARAGAPWRSGV